MPDQTDIDVNSAAASSAEATTASEGQTTDVNSQADSSSAASNQQGTETLEDAAKRIVEKANSSNAEVQATEPEKDATESQTTVEEGQTEDKGPIPYERFAEVNSKKVELEAQVKQLEPLVQQYYSIHNYLQQNGISPAEYQNWMDIYAKFKTNPAEALEALKPHLQVMQGFTGEAIDPDLQEAVNNSEISLKYAKELMATRTKSKFVQQQSQLSQQQQQKMLEHQYQTQLQQTLNAWVTNKASLIPEFKPKANESDPDGLFEFALNKFAIAAKTANLRDDKDMVALLESSLKSVQSSFSKFVPKPTVNGSRNIRSSQSNLTAPRAPKTIEEMVSSYAKEKGIPYSPRT